MLIKYSGKYIEIYLKLKIAFLFSGFLSLICNAADPSVASFWASLDIVILAVVSSGLLFGGSFGSLELVWGSFSGCLPFLPFPVSPVFLFLLSSIFLFLLLLFCLLFFLLPFQHFPLLSSLSLLLSFSFASFAFRLAPPVAFCPPIARLFLLLLFCFILLLLCWLRSFPFSLPIVSSCLFFRHLRLRSTLSSCLHSDRRLLGDVGCRHLCFPFRLLRCSCPIPGPPTSFSFLLLLLLFLLFPNCRLGLLFVDFSCSFLPQGSSVLSFRLCWC